MIFRPLKFKNPARIKYRNINKVLPVEASAKNFAYILAVDEERRPHQPMRFFLRNLAINGEGADTSQ
jgi:hypothetical protein